MSGIRPFLIRRLMLSGPFKARRRRLSGGKAYRCFAKGWSALVLGSEAKHITVGVFHLHLISPGVIFADVAISTR
jgi:hypothetical protein